MNPIAPTTNASNDLAKRPRSILVTIAYVVAFLGAALAVANVALGQLLAVLFFAIFLVAGIGILRSRAWSAYGLALVLASQVLILGISVLRSPATAVPSAPIVTGALFNLILIILFVFAGRSLAATDAPRGRALPWMVLAILIFVPFVFVQPFVIPVGSMEDTILIGDHILVLRVPRILPQRGDLTVFRYPIDRRQVFVKRVIGVAGDRIKIVRKMVFRNGALLNEPYATHKSGYMDSYRDNFPSEPSGFVYPGAAQMLKDSVHEGELVVPNGCYFVLGDNRDSSLDSRYWGFVEPTDMLGRPLIVLYSQEAATDEAIDKKPPVPTLLRVRWNRIFKPL
jgi:signal peptidase I